LALLERLQYSKLTAKELNERNEREDAMTVSTTGIGLKHDLWTGEPEGARCQYEGDNLHLAVFLKNPQAGEVRPSKPVRLGLFTHERNIFLILKIGQNYYDMPYFYSGPLLAQLPAGSGLTATLAVCDEMGTCRSLAGRFLTNAFSNAFVTAINRQIGIKHAEHELAVQSAYAKYSPKQMFQGTTIFDEGWESLGE
jgi:hypothetical protein